MMDDIHVYPLNGLRTHDTESRECSCGPKVEVYSFGQAVIVHNSYDGREITERAEAYVERAIN
jgi:hypothetical protein